VVFVGVPTEREVLDARQVRWRFTVERVAKGQLGATTTLVAGASGNTCGYAFTRARRSLCSQGLGRVVF
jgi:hypothetical protein